MRTGAKRRKAERPPELIARKPSRADARRPAFEGPIKLSDCFQQALKKASAIGVAVRSL